MGELRGRFSRGTDLDLPWKLRVDRADSRLSGVAGGASIAVVVVVVVVAAVVFT